MSATPEQIAERLDRLRKVTPSRLEAVWGGARLADDIRAAVDRISELEIALSAIVRLSQETDELTELSAKEIIEALVNCEQTARAALAGAR